MNPLKATMQQAISGMSVQTQRINVAAENLSNADTPGYKAKLLSMQPGMTAAEAFKTLQISLNETPGEQEFDPSHPLANEEGYVTLSNVSLVTEMADMREANRGYEANLNAFQQARNMYRSLLEVLKR